MNGLSVVIPSKTRSNLEACVQAIRNAGETCQIIVVDDFPREVGEGHPLADCKGYLAHDPSAQPMLWCMGEKPFIFSRNINIGISAAGDDDVLLLNDDALLRTPMGFSSLHACANEHQEYGIISAACNNVGNTNQHPQNRGLREDPRMVCFVSVLIPHRTIHSIGMLDPRFSAYGLEDDDLCLRALRAGLKIGIFDGCVMDHKSLPSTFRGEGGGDFRENLEIFKAKWGMDNWGNPAPATLPLV